MRKTRLTPGQRFLLLFTMTVIAPGLVLAALGARALWQERRQMEQELSQRLDRAAQSVARELGRQLDRLGSLADGSPTPENAFRDWPLDASWGYVDQREGARRVYPRQVFPYDLGPAKPASTSPPELAEVAQWEAQSTPEQLAAKYRQLLPQVSAALQPEVKHRLARVPHRSGGDSEALKLWREVQSGGGMIGSLPAELVAEFEIGRSSRKPPRSYTNT